MINDALLDVACPICPAEVLELCTVGGRYMESTVHYPRRSLADVPLEDKPEPKRKGGRPKGAISRADPTKCASGKHDWNDENTFTSLDGGQRCRPCRNEGRRARRQRPEAVHRYNSNTCRNGHEYTPENTYRAPGNGPRRCIACKQAQRKKATT